MTTSRLREAFSPSPTRNMSLRRPPSVIARCRRPVAPSLCHRMLCFLYVGPPWASTAAKCPRSRSASASRPKSRRLSASPAALSLRRSRASTIARQHAPFASRRASAKATRRGGARRTDSSASMRGTNTPISSPQPRTLCQSALSRNGSREHGWKPQSARRPKGRKAASPPFFECVGSAGHRSSSAKGPEGSSRMYVASSSQAAVKNTTGALSPPILSPPISGQSKSKCSKHWAGSDWRRATRTRSSAAPKITETWAKPVVASCAKATVGTMSVASGTADAAADAAAGASAPDLRAGGDGPVRMFAKPTPTDAGSSNAAQHARSRRCHGRKRRLAAISAAARQADIAN
mmetsp:Transcript_49143/g.137606  ORF Transcript_49143/g.137606 Transcript_49143/m.137606 type:complete len:348 (+) Transcript_49143:478-1521(+)